MLSILNNAASMQAQQSLTNTNSNLGTALQRLSTGLQINSGADGPAAYVISESEQAQVAGLNQAINNTNQAVDLVQTGSGALNEISNLLVQIRGLALDSANAGVNDAAAQAANQAQVTNALDTIDTIAASTQFDGQNLLNGSAGYNAVSSNSAVTDLSSTSSTELGTFQLDVTQSAQSGQIDAANDANAANNLSNTANLAQDETLTFTNGSTGTNTNVYLSQGMTNTQVIAAVNQETASTGVVASLDPVTGSLVLTAQNLGQNFSVVSSVADSTNGSTGIGQTVIDTATATAGATNIVTLNGQGAAGTLTDASGNVFSFSSAAGNTNGNVVTFNQGSPSGLSFALGVDPTNSATTDPAALGTSIVTTSNGSLQFQIGANSGQTADLSISSMETDAIGTGVANNPFSNLSRINVTTAQGATDSIAVIDAAISQVSNLAATLGAFQTNTLQANASNLQTALTNTQSSEATITDTNYAQEISQYTQLQTQMQAGSSVLTNANQANQYITQMLQKM